MSGSVGYWEREWLGSTVYEMGWLVLAEHQGTPTRRSPTRPSNAVCHKAGFELLGEIDFEYPKGVPIRCCDWRLHLRALTVY